MRWVTCLWICLIHNLSEVHSPCTDLVTHSSLPLCCKYCTVLHDILYGYCLYSLVIDYLNHEICNFCLNSFLRFIYILSVYVLFLFLNVFDNTFFPDIFVLLRNVQFLSVILFSIPRWNVLKNIIIMNNCFWHLSSWECLFDFESHYCCPFHKPFASEWKGLNWKFSTFFSWKSVRNARRRWKTSSRLHNR